MGCTTTCTTSAQIPEQPDFATHIQPLLETLCFDCHGNGAEEGKLQFDAAESEAALIADRQLWGKVWENVLAETMPPADMPQPTHAERATLSRWIGQKVFQVDPEQPDPGRVTIRRLNRVEYGYSVLDLLGVEFPVADHFPVDDTGYGFDTIGDVLTVPPTLMDKYFDAAAQISEELLEQATLSEADRSDAYGRIFDKKIPPSDRAEQFRLAREIIEQIATQAYRHPVGEATLEKLLRLTRPAFHAGEATYQEVVCRAIEAILVSPRFIYRAEFQPRPDDPQKAHRLDEFALASRLSYFLWSSLPDEKLLDLAKQGKLREALDAQVQRMLEDGKSNRFVENFVGQWLQTRDVMALHRSEKLQQKIQQARYSMPYETEALFRHILRGNRPAIELINADYSFLNEALAKFYGIADVKGEELRWVQFAPGSVRGGILTHASVLLVTSNPDRTSPVKRGQFILENILGMPVPPAPPEVPALEDSQEEGDESLSFRAQLARHRADPMCATCHDRMDPLGLGLENFDAVGLWREEDAGEPIDASSQLASGERFAGIRELRTILSTKKRLFYRCLTRKLMTYALGRGIEYTDIPEVETIVDAMLANDGRFLTMLMGIIESPQFQMCRGNGDADRAPSSQSHSDE